MSVSSLRAAPFDGCVPHSDSDGCDDWSLRAPGLQSGRVSHGRRPALRRCAASLCKSMGAASLYKAMGAASLYKSMGAASLHKSMGAASLFESMGAGSLHKSMEAASLYKSMGAVSLHKSMEAASLYKSAAVMKEEIQGLTQPEQTNRVHVLAWVWCGSLNITCAGTQRVTQPA